MNKYLLSKEERFGQFDIQDPRYHEEDRKDKEGKEWKPKFKDVVQHCSLDEIKEMLLDDPELDDYERFELYYDEHKRVQKEKKKANDMLKKEYKKYKTNRKKNTNNQ